jgi:hypothetical protein
MGFEDDHSNTAKAFREFLDSLAFRLSMERALSVLMMGPQGHLIVEDRVFFSCLLVVADFAKAQGIVSRKLLSSKALNALRLVKVSSMTGSKSRQNYGIEAKADFRSSTHI